MHVYASYHSRGYRFYEQLELKYRLTKLILILLAYYVLKFPVLASDSNASALLERNPFMQILPPKCGLPLDALALIESIGTINQQFESNDLDNSIESEFTTTFQVWYRFADDDWQMKQTGEQLIEDWLIQAINTDELMLLYEGEIDKRCEDSTTVREYRLLI